MEDKLKAKIVEVLDRAMNAATIASFLTSKEDYPITFTLTDLISLLNEMSEKKRIICMRYVLPDSRIVRKLYFPNETRFLELK